MKYTSLFIIGFLLFVSSCKEYKTREKTYRLIQEWSGKEILFPSNMVFTMGESEVSKDTLKELYLKIIQGKPLNADEPAKYQECRMFVVYADGNYGYESLLDHKKKPGWL
ncbi:hypothetical protein EVD33_13265 [Bacteroidales bacterium SW292]|mgnify:CR=1 FL=1|nr:hypothetical protein [Bacteroidales bacterium SW292]